MGRFVTPTGFQRKTLQEIKLDLEDSFRAGLGQNIDLSAPSPLGQIVGISAKAFADLWDGLQEIYTANDPSSATGTALDVLSAITGVTRLQAVNAIADCVLYTDDPITQPTIPAGKLARRVRGSVDFSLRHPVTLKTSSLRDAYLTLPVISAGMVVSLTTSFGVFSATASSTADPRFSVLQSLASAINASAFNGSAIAYRPTTAPKDAQYKTQDCLRIVDTVNDFSVSLGGSWMMSLFGCNGIFDCMVAGIETATAGEITEITTPVSGWKKVCNLTNASPGRNAESDEELRRRRATFNLSRYATEEAIQQAVINKAQGVTACTVVSNRNILPDLDGRPPKSFEVLVHGGENHAIAQAIWDTMPAGIQTHKDPETGVSVELLDSQGQPQIVNFSRPAYTYLWVKVQYNSYDEELFPADGGQQMRDKLLAWSLQEYTMGKDIIPTRIMSPLYQVPGIGSMTISVAVTDSPSGSPSYVTDIIPISARKLALLDVSRISLIRDN